MRTTYIVTVETRDSTDPDSMGVHDVADALRSDFDDRILVGVDVEQLVQATSASQLGLPVSDAA